MALTPFAAGNDVVLLDKSDPTKCFVRERATLAGHTGQVSCVAFSPDGKTVASASSDKSVILWNAMTGVQKATVEHTVQVYGVAFSPDGKYIATCGDGGVLMQWDATTLKAVVTLSGHAAFMSCVAFSPDSAILASCGKDKTVKLWHVARCKEIATLSGHTNTVWSVAFSNDGKALASGSADKTTKLWDVATQTLKATLTGHASSVNSVAFSPLDDVVASASDDKRVKLWDTASGTLKKTLEGHTDGVLSVAFSPDAKTLISGGDTSIVIWDVASGAIKAKVEGHTDNVTAAISPDGKTIASGSWDTTAKLWDYADGAVKAVLKGHAAPVHDADLCSSGQHVLSRSTDGVGIVWDAETERKHGIALCVSRDQLLALCCQKRDQRPAATDAARIQQLEREVAEQKATVADVLAATKPLQSNLKQIDGTANQLRSDNSQLSKTISEKDAEIAQARAGHTAEVACLQAHIKQLQDENKTLRESQPRSNNSNIPLVMADMPYRFDRSGIAVYQTSSKQLVVKGQTSTRMLHAGVTPLPPHLQGLWDKGGVCGRPVFGFRFVRFDALTFENGDTLIDGCRAASRMLAQHRESQLPEFNRNFDELPPNQRETKKAVVRLLKKMFVVPYRAANVLYTFHGCGVGSVESILSHSLLALHRGDGGFFGQGVYTTPNVEYACRYASGEFGTIPAKTTGAPDPSDPTAPPEGCYAVLCCASVVSMVYPVTHDTDYKGGSKRSVFFADKGEPPKGMLPGCDANFVPVSEADGFQAVAPKYAQYFEVTQSQSALAVPMGVLWVQAI